MKRFILSPPVLFFISIVGSLLIKINFNSNLEDISSDTTYLIFGSLVSFVVGYLSMNLLKPNYYFFKEYICIRLEGRFHNGVNALFLISIACSLCIFLYILSLVGGDLASFRDFYLENQRVYFVFPYILYFCATYYLLIYAIRGGYLYLLLYILIAISDSIFKLQKSSFMTFMWALLLVQLMISNFSIANIFLILLIIFGMVGLISYMFVFREGNGVEILAESVVNYMTISFVNFDINIAEMNYLGCVNLFGAAGKYLLPSSYCDPDVFNTYGHYNVYSFLLEPYIFGGAVCVVVVFFLLGGLYYFLHRESMRSSFGLVLYAYLSFPLVISFFAYAFNWNEWIYVYIFLLISFSSIAIKK